MKKTIHTLILLISSSLAYAQLPAGFSDNAPCQLRVNNTSDLFDWQKETYEIFFNDGYRAAFPSPWYATSNPNVDFLRLQENKDWTQAGGWEFVQRNFGTAQNAVKHAHMILYNRYSGILRVFVAIGEVPGPYTSAVIVLTNRRDRQATQVKRTAILERYSSGQGKGALDNFATEIDSARVANYYSTFLPKWMYADFVMTYDPCTCNSLSQLRATAQLISESNLTFTLEGQAVQNIAKDGQTTGGMQTLMKGVKNVKGAIDAGVGMYKTLNDGVETASKILNIGEKVETESLINSLGCRTSL
jgi:hypothetical protein